MNSRFIKVWIEMHATSSETTMGRANADAGPAMVTVTFNDERQRGIDISLGQANSHDSLTEHIKRLHNGEDPGSFQDCLDRR